MKISNTGYVTAKLGLFRDSIEKCVPLYQTRITDGETEALVFQISGAGLERTHWIKREDIVV